VSSLDEARSAGLYCKGLTESPIKGTNGNREYLALMKPEQSEYGFEAQLVEKLFAQHK